MLVSRRFCVAGFPLVLRLLRDRPSSWTAGRCPSRWAERGRHRRTHVAPRLQGLWQSRRHAPRSRQPCEPVRPTQSRWRTQSTKGCTHDQQGPAFAVAVRPREGGGAVITVEDAGPGLPEAKLAGLGAKGPVPPGSARTSPVAASTAPAVPSTCDGPPWVGAARIVATLLIELSSAVGAQPGRNHSLVWPRSPA
jgi:hypothetical protein